MTVYIWDGSTDGDFDDATNYTANSGTPTAGDEVLFTGTPTTSPSGATWQADVDLKAIRVAADYTGTICASAVPLTLGATSVYIDAENSGNIYIGGYSSAKKLDSIYILNTADSGTVYLSGAYLGTLYAIKGNIDVKTGSTLAGLNISYRDSPSSDVRLTINDADGNDTTLPATIECRGGIIQNYSQVQTLNLLDGTWEQGDADGTTCGSIAYAENNVLTVRGGKLMWYGGDIAAGTTALVHLYTGEIDGSEGKSARTLNGTVTIYDGGKLNLQNGLANITVTNALNVKGQTAQVWVDTGRTLTVSAV